MELKNFLKSGKYNIAYKLYKQYKKITRKERFIGRENGIFPQKTVYVIKRIDSAGFFSNFFYALGHIVYATEKGYTVVVDMETYPTLYNEKKAINGTKNAWEYYFEQPDDITLEEAYQCKNSILSSDEYLWEYVPCYTEGCINPLTTELVESLNGYVDKYIKPHQEILEEVDEIRGMWGENVLGIHIRGTDMKNAKGHPVPADIDQYIRQVDIVLAQQNIDKIFCCTDEADILQAMQKKYADFLVYTSSFRSADGVSVHRNKGITRVNHKYQIGREVLIDALLLSKCQYLIFGHSNVPYAAIILNKNQYKKSIFIAPQ